LATPLQDSHFPWLGRVSRTFALSLRALPRDLRKPVELAYLAARAADTVADREWIPAAARGPRLAEIRTALSGGRLAEAAWTGLAAGAPRGDPTAAAEAALVAAVGQVLESIRRLPAPDRREVEVVVTTLVATMEDELQRFPGGGPLAALPDAAALTAYTEGIAGCVGAFWTRLAVSRLPQLKPAARWLEHAGRRYGRGLQLVNVLRDLRRDLARGKCFLPAPELTAAGLAPADLLDPGMLPRVRGLLARWEARARSGLMAGLLYAARLPVHPSGLRLATALPARLGFLTLDRLADAPARLDARTSIRISRADVWTALAWTLVCCLTPRGPLRLATRLPRGRE